MERALYRIDLNPSKKTLAFRMCSKCYGIKPFRQNPVEPCNYTNSLNRWIKFASDHKFVMLPVSDVTLFYSHLSAKQVSASVIESVYCLEMGS